MKPIRFSEEDFQAIKAIARKAKRTGKTRTHKTISGAVVSVMPIRDETQDCDKPREFNYFMRCVYTGHIKIGYSTDPYARLSQIKSTNLFDVEMVHIQKGTFVTERLLHQRFAKYRVSGEWFECEGELAEFLDGLEKCLDLPK